MSCTQYCSTYTGKTCTAVNVLTPTALDYVTKTILNYNVALGSLGYDDAVAPLIFHGGKRYGTNTAPNTCGASMSIVHRIWFDMMRCS